MNKYFLLSVAVIVILGIGGWAYFNQKSTSSATSATTELPNAVENNNDQKPAQKKSTVEKIAWLLEMTNPSITDPNDPRKYEQTVSIDVTFANKSTKHYLIGKAYGCDATNVAQEGEVGRMKCYFALTGVDFVAYTKGTQFVVERHAESARDGSIQKTIVLEI